MSAKTECVAKGGINNSVLRFIEGEIQFLINLRIGGGKINGRRNNVISDGQDRSNGFNSTGSTQQMTGHGFGGTDVQFIGMFSKKA